MSKFRNLIDYFKPKPKFKRVPRQIISDYKIQNANEQERLLMLFNKARSPKAARELLKKYQVETATEVLKLLPQRKPITFRTRFNRLLLKMSGHHEGDPYRCDLEIKDRNKL